MVNNFKKFMSTFVSNLKCREKHDCCINIQMLFEGILQSL